MDKRPVSLGVTVLTTTGRLLKLAKELLLDGSVKAHSAAKWFAARQVPCGTPEELFSLLLELADDPHSAIVTEPPRVELAPNEPDRGAKADALGDDRLATRLRDGCLELRKLGQNFDTKALTRVAMFDVDDWTRAQFDPMGIMGYCPIADRVEIARDWIKQHLPQGYHDVDFILQLSASSVLPQNHDRFKAHIWFILAEPYAKPDMHAWVKSIVGVDPSPFGTAHLHYTSKMVGAKYGFNPVALVKGSRPYADHAGISKARIAPAAHRGTDGGPLMVDPLQLKQDHGWNDPEEFDCCVLRHINMDMPEPEWFSKVICGLAGMYKGTQQEEEAIEVGIRASERSEKYQGGDIRTAFTEKFERAGALGPNGRTTAVGTLIQMAQEAGANPHALRKAYRANGVTVAQKHSRPRYQLRTAADLAKAPPMQWLVRGVLPCEGLAALYGPSGSGKSFLALDLAAAIGIGAPTWFGHRVTQSPVTYCVLEGDAGMGKRINAWAKHHEKPLPDGLRFVTEPFDLRDREDLAALASAIQDEGGVGGLVVLDTLNRAAPGADENSSVDMGNIIAAAKRLQKWVGGLVLLVHHTGKDTTRGLRGHSSLYAALDAAIEVSRADSRREWSVAKSKDDVDGGTHPFVLHDVELGQDDHGDAITSCVVESDGAMKEARRPQPQGPNQKLVYKAVNELLRASMNVGEGGAPPGRPCVELEAAMRAGSATLACEPKRRHTNAQRAIEAMSARGIYGINDDWLWAV
ncbi:AAA family ATPase [Paraburkholderia sp. RL18-085-BIA-A]|uniref:AAA family ATPase n=1 Tax=Paraburkholderia sp. RL18-085-BIA-A TaxID=3031633 RepID=UPI0038B9288C